MVVDFDIDGDGKVTEQEVAMKERMLEVELREEKAESQKKMAWIAMIMMIGFTVVLFTPLMSDTRVSSPCRLAWVVLYCTNWYSGSVYGSYSLHGREADGQ